MIILKVKIKFQDGKERIYDCYDVPMFGSTWVTLYIRSAKSLERKLLLVSSILEINQYYENGKKKRGSLSDTVEEVTPLGFKK